MAEPQKFRSYEEFLDFYLRQHSDAGNRHMRAVGAIQKRVSCDKP